MDKRGNTQKQGNNEKQEGKEENIDSQENKGMEIIFYSGQIMESYMTY